MLQLTETCITAEDSLTQEQADDLLSWLQVTLGNRIQKAKVNEYARQTCFHDIHTK